MRRSGCRHPNGRANGAESVELPNEASDHVTPCPTSRTVARSHRRRAVVRHLDLSRLPDAAAVVDELAGGLGGLDAFVNHSGTSKQAPFLELAWEDWSQTLDVDLNGALLCAQRAARRMVEHGRGGRIVNVTSVHEHVPLPESAAYVAAKHGLGGLTKQMALELAAHGITVNAVAPGEIATEMTGNDRLALLRRRRVRDRGVVRRRRRPLSLMAAVRDE